MLRFLCSMPSKDVSWSLSIFTKTKTEKKKTRGRKVKSVVLSQTIHKRTMHGNTSHQNQMYILESPIAGDSMRNVCGLRGSC